MRRLRQIGASAERSETSAEDSETATTLGAARDWAPTGRSGPTSWAGLPPAPSSSRCSPPLSLVVSCVGGERFWEILASSGQVGQIGHFSGGFWDEPFPQPRLGEAGFRFLVDSPLDRSAAGAPYLSAAKADVLNTARWAGMAGNLRRATASCHPIGAVLCVGARTSDAREPLAWR